MMDEREIQSLRAQAAGIETIRDNVKAYHGSDHLDVWWDTVDDVWRVGMDILCPQDMGHLLKVISDVLDELKWTMNSNDGR